jgi:chemotaxis protein MotB
MSPKKKGKGLESAADNWLISYADMMTLLLFLFIILYQVAAQKSKSVQAAPAAAASAVSSASSQSPAGASGKAASYYYISKSSSAVSSAAPAKSSPGAAGKKSSARTGSRSKTAAGAKSSGGKSPTYGEVKAFANSSLGSNVSVKQTQTGIVFDIQAEVLFDPGKSQIKAGSFSLLNRIANYLKSLPNDIIIAGYTDNQPVHNSSYQSNWELSCDRAAKVLRYFTDTEKLSPERFQAVGYGEYRPIADNTTANGRFQNRRVEIIVVKSSG